MLSVIQAPVQARVVTPKKPYGGTLVIGDSNQPTLVNPVLTNLSISVSLMNVVFNRLVRVNPLGELVTDLAKSWDISSDGFVYTFHLRSGVKFHDGTEFTSADVLYTYQKIRNQETGSPFFSEMSNVQGFTAPDRYTFKVILKEPQASFINQCTREIMPKHLYEGTDIRKSPFNYKPVGTGPFKFKEWTRDGQITLEANPDYFEGRPYLDRVVFKTYKNRSEVWSALMRGEVDLIRFMSVEDYEITKKDASFKTYATPVPDYYLISYNLGDPVLADPKVRLAIACAIDRKGLIEKVDKGYGVESIGPFFKGSWAFNPKVKPILYDPAQAISFLKEAGWQDKDGDGLLEKSGKSLVIRMMVDSRDEKMRKMAMLIRQQLQEVGIRLEIRLYQDETEMNNSVSLNDMQAHLTYYIGGGPDPNETAKLWGSGDLRKGKIWTHSKLDPEMDRLINLGQITQNKKNRGEIYQNLHEIIYGEQQACFLYFPFMFHAVSKKVHGADSFLNSMHMPDYTMKDFYVQN